ncbi:hypothetical protein Tco_1356106, partial [Tanacetum coccineum]
MLKELQSDLKYSSPTLIAVESDQVENLTRQLEDQAGSFAGKLAVEGGLDPILAYTAGAEIEQLQWSSLQPDWFAIAFASKL